VCSTYCYRPSSVVCPTLSVCQSVCHLVSNAKTAEAIKMPFASRTRVGPGKHLLHMADRFGRILYCVHSTQYSFLVEAANDTLFQRIISNGNDVLFSLLPPKSVSHYELLNRHYDRQLIIRKTLICSITILLFVYFIQIVISHLV